MKKNNTRWNTLSQEVKGLKSGLVINTLDEQGISKKKFGPHLIWCYLY